MLIYNNKTVITPKYLEEDLNSTAFLDVFVSGGEISEEAGNLCERFPCSDERFEGTQPITSNCIWIFLAVITKTILPPVGENKLLEPLLGDDIANKWVTLDYLCVLGCMDAPSMFCYIMHDCTGDG